MGKRYVNVEEVQEVICPKKQGLYADGSIILSPQIKDMLKSQEITLYYESKPCGIPSSVGCTDACASATQTIPALSSAEHSVSMQSVIQSIMQSLCTEYGVKDAPTLEKLTWQILKEIQAKL